jgi:transcriptional regulator with XRE-family HTH domain
MDRAAFASALRLHRERVTPAEVGLPVGRHRRVAGLRREEVAQLAGVSVDYVSRLEQARGPVPSNLVLAALARALRLTDDERDHLFRLAGSAPPLPHHIVSVPRAATLRLLDRLSDLPALLVDAKGDLLAWNSMATALFGDFSAWPLSQRNLAWQQFLGPSRRHLATGGRPSDSDKAAENWSGSDRVRAGPGDELNLRVGGDPEEADRLAAETVADLRMKAARYPDDPGLHQLLRELNSNSPRFAARWAAGQVNTTHSPPDKAL